MIGGREIVIPNIRAFRESYRAHRKAGCSRLEAAEAAAWICAAGALLAKKQREGRGDGGSTAGPNT